MEVSARLHASVSVPSNSVDNTWGNENYADWAHPALSLFGIASSGLGNFKLNAALYLDVWK
jgi:hypothetical protein